MHGKPRDHTLLGAVVALVSVVVFVLVFTNTPSRLTARHGTTVRAIFRDAQQLRPGDPVRVDGVEAGRVTSIEQQDGGRSALVEMTVFEEAMPLYADARAWVRWRTLLGGLFVVDLHRGTSAAGPLPGGTIKQEATTNQVLIEDLANTFRPNARRGFRTTLTEVPQALADPEAPEAALGAVADAAPGLARGVRAVRGVAEGDLTRLVQGASRTVRALDQPAADLRRVVAGAATTLGATSRRSAELRSTLRQLGRLGPEVISTLQATTRTLRGADPLLADLRPVAGDVGPTARRLRTTVGLADGVLTDAGPLTRALRPAAASLAGTARRAGPLLEGLRPGLERLDRRILPDLAVTSPESGRKTYEMVGPTISGLTGAIAYFDDENYFVRFPASGSESAFDSAPCRTYITNTTQADDQLADCQALTRLLGKALGGGAGR